MRSQTAFCGVTQANELPPFGRVYARRRVGRFRREGSRPGLVPAEPSNRCAGKRSCCMAVDKLKSLVGREPRLDQNEAPLVEALRGYLEADVASFVIPAHKQGRALDPDTLAALGADTYRHDVGLLNGLDDIHESLELQVRAQDLAADLFGADKAFFLVNGSTLSVQCAITAVARPGE